MISPAESHAPRPGPPREGKTFFLLWSAGSLAGALWERGLNFTGLASPFTPGANPNALAVYLPFLAIGAAWQAWLLFRPGWRFLGWMAIDVAGFGALWIMVTMLQHSLVSGSGGGLLPLSLFTLALVLILPIFKCVLLTGVRRRPWGWLLVSVGTIAFSTIGSLILGTPRATEFLQWLAGFMPVGTQSDLLAAASAGLNLLAGIAMAAAMAWWITPICSTPPPPPSSTDLPRGKPPTPRDLDLLLR